MHVHVQHKGHLCAQWLDVEKVASSGWIASVYRAPAESPIRVFSGEYLSHSAPEIAVFT